MNENQKTILKGYLCFFSGFFLSLISITIIVIYANVFRNPYGLFPVYVLFALTFIGYLVSTSSAKYNIMFLTNFKLFMHPSITTGKTKWFIQGVPNNKFNEFNLRYDQIISFTQLILNETTSGIYEFVFNDKVLKFDMRGWIRKEYYILEYFLTILQLNKNKDICKSKNIKNIEEIKIIFNKKNQKKIQKFLIKNHKTCLPMLFKYRLYTKYKIISMYNLEAKNIKCYFHFN